MEHAGLRDTEWAPAYRFNRLLSIAWAYVVPQVRLARALLARPDA